MIPQINSYLQATGKLLVAMSFKEYNYRANINPSHLKIEKNPTNFFQYEHNK